MIWIRLIFICNTETVSKILEKISSFPKNYELVVVISSQSPSKKFLVDSSVTTKLIIKRIRDSFLNPVFSIYTKLCMVP